MPRRLTSYEQKIRSEKFNEGLLWCSCCQRFLPVSKFYQCKDRVSNYGYRYYCKGCEYDRKREKLLRYAATRNKALKEKFVELTGGCCQRCGYNEYRAALSYHHIYSSSKKYQPGGVIYSADFEKAWEELDKCCLLCQNCHLGYEAGEWRAEFIKRDGLGWTVGKELPLDDDRYTRISIDVAATPIPEEYQNRENGQLLFEWF